MLSRVCKLGYGISTKVLKQRTDEGPLPNMIKYSLLSEKDEPLSFWNDVPINFEGDTVNCVVEIPK